jgi:beta-galactosidase
VIRIGVDYYPEQWDESLWEKDIADMAALGVKAVRIGEFAWSKLEPEEGVYDFGWMDKAIKMIAGAGMQVIIGTPTNCAPLWLYEEHPETLQCERDGARTKTGIRGHRCQTNKTFRAYVEKIVRAEAKRYAGRPEILAWQIDNEVEDSRCTCPSCTERFQEYVKAKHHTLEQLNRDWGTSVWSGEYSSWTQVKPFVTAAVNRSDWFNPAYMLDYERFCSAMTAEYVKFQADLIREYDPKAVITTNSCFGLHLQDFRDEFRSLDVASYDNYPELRLPKDPETIYSNSFALDFVRGFKNQNFWIMEQLGGPMGCWMPITPQMEPGMLEGYALQAVAHGADLLSFFRWRTATTGAEMFCYGLEDHNGHANRRTRELGALAKRLEKIPGLDRTEPLAQVAIVYSHDAGSAFATQYQSEGFDYMKQLRAFDEACQNLGLGAAVIGEADDLSSYRIVVVPSLAIVHEGFARKLEEFVSQGGQAIITCRSGVKDENGNCILGEDLPTVFRTICGCHVDESDAIGSREQEISWGEKTLANTSWCDLLVCDTAEPVATYKGRYYDGVPAVTKNSFGQGSCLYAGTLGGKAFCRALLKEAARGAGIVCSELPWGVEESVRSGEGVTYRFYFNNTLEPKSVVADGAEIELAPLEVRIEDGEGSWL